jgi:dethiobiotin synthetase
LNSKHIFIAGIGTEVGKTVASAIVTQALKADYWKPVQSGDLHDTDSHKIARLVSNSSTRILPETYRFKHPASPHLSAAMEGQTIDLQRLTSDYHRISTDRPTVIEGAGGLMVPLNDRDLYLDWLRQMQIPVVLVSRHYLGSINHTLLSVAALRQANIPIKGIIFNGHRNESSESAIIYQTNLPVLLRIEEVNVVDTAFVETCSQQILLG